MHDELSFNNFAPLDMQGHWFRRKCQKTKYMITSFQQNVVQNQNIIIGNLLIENVEKFKYLGVAVTNTNDICEEIRYRLNVGNACHHSLDKILLSLILQPLHLVTSPTSQALHLHHLASHPML